MKKIVSSILIILLALVLIASAVLPAFAAEESNPASTIGFIGTPPADISEFIAGFRNPSALHFIVLGVAVLVLALLVFLVIKGSMLLTYRSKAKYLADENFAYVQLTGLPLNLILAHFTEFANRNHSLRTMERHFLDELYIFYLAQKSEELAKLDEASSKDRSHLQTRAAVYRKTLEDNYSYEDFANLLPLDTDTIHIIK